MNFNFQSFICIVVVFSFLLDSSSLIAQDINKQSDTLKQKKKLDIVGLPSIGYSPETKFTVGAAVVYSYFLAPPSPICRKSSAQLKFVYSFARQIEVAARWNLFTSKNLYFIRGQSYYLKNNDRNYGIGNGGLTSIIEYKDSISANTRYINFRSKQLYFSTIAARMIFKHFYLGVDYEFESIYDVSNIADRVELITNEFFTNPIAGVRSGLGFNITFDNRDNVNAPHKGFFVALSNRFYGKIIGSDYKYENLSIDFRYYKSTWKNQVIAVNLRTENRFISNPEDLPIYALARFSGKDFIKGYFRGTYQDKNMLGFQLEYRALLFKTPWVPYLKAVGAVAMLNGGQVYQNFSEVGNFRYSTGFGFRAVLDEEQRISTGVDFAWGLHKKSTINGGQFGVYISLSETF